MSLKWIRRPQGGGGWGFFQLGVSDDSKKFSFNLIYGTQGKILPKMFYIANTQIGNVNLDPCCVKLEMIIVINNSMI